MTRQRALSPLTLLLASLLCYGFVLVWTQTVTLDTTISLEDLSTPFSPVEVRLMSGGNFSVSVAPLERSTEPPVVTTNLAIHNTATKDSITLPLPTTMESLSTMVTTGGPETTTEDELISTIGSTWAPMGTPASNGVSALTERLRSTTELGLPEESSTGMVAEKNVIPVSSSVGENVKVSTGTTMAGGTTDIAATSTGVRVSRNLSAPLKPMEETSSGGKLTWRVKLQSRLSREDAIRTFYEKVCSEIIRNLHVKGISVSGGPGLPLLRCQ